MKTSATLTKIAPALVAAQAAIEAATKDQANPFFDSKYANLASVIAAVKAPLNANGIAFSQLVQRDEHGIYVETVLLHTSGEYITSQTPVIVAKPNNPQAMVSGVTYAKRCGLEAITGLPSVDDDGNGATVPPTQQPQAAAQQKPKPPKTVDQMTNDACTHWIWKQESADAAIMIVQQSNSLDAAAIKHIRDEFAKKPDPLTEDVSGENVT